MTLIDGDRIITDEEFTEEKMSIIDCIKANTDEGQTRWIPVSEKSTVQVDTESEDKPKTGHCNGCRWRKDIDEVFRRGVSMESLCASCYVRNKE